MNFVRKKKRGQNKKVQKTWYSEEGYRILWRKEVFGIAVPARYQACVRLVIPNFGGKPGEFREMWDFVNPARRLHKTMKAAEEDCERHCRLWTKACEASGIRALTEIFGKLPFGFPAWAKKSLNPKVFAVLIRPRTSKIVDDEEPCESSPPAGEEPSPSDLTSPLPTSDSNTSPTEAEPGLKKTRKRGRASDAGEAAESSTPKTRRARSKATSTDEPSSAPPAKEAAKAPAKRSRKPTAKPSASGGRKRKSTAASSKPVRKPSKGSRTKKSKPSAS